MRIANILRDYFLSSIKTLSTGLIIIFNIFLLGEFLFEKISIGELILSYLVQISIYLLFFGILIFSLRRFISVGKKAEGKGVKLGLLVFIVFMWVFYGIAIYILSIGAMKQVYRLELNFFIGILIAFGSIILNFILNFSIERERLEKTDMVKVFLIMY